MAAKRSNTGVIVFAGVVAVAAGIGGGIYWTSRADPNAAAAGNPSTSPTLPEERLVFAGTSVTEARYVVGGDIKPSQAPVQVTVLIVGKTTSSVEQRYAIAVKRELLDCTTRTITQEVVGLYDQSGKLATNKYETGPNGRAVESADSEASVVCDHLPEVVWRTKIGWRAALREFQHPPAEIDAQLTAQPENPVLWAWRCRSVAQGDWRPDGREVCDRAVKLNPDDASTRLDRGFLALALGDRKAALRDFDALAAKAPDNAPALFGRGLIKAMSGAAAASKADRGNALKLDPKTPNWIEETYRFNISSQYWTA